MLRLAFTCHVGPLYLYGGKEISMIDPDYDSMADYVDVESINTPNALGPRQVT